MLLRVKRNHSAKSGGLSQLRDFHLIDLLFFLSTQRNRLPLAMTKRKGSRPAAVLGLPVVCELATLCFNASSLGPMRPCKCRCRCESLPCDGCSLLLAYRMEMLEYPASGVTRVSGPRIEVDVTYSYSRTAFYPAVECICGS